MRSRTSSLLNREARKGFALVLSLSLMALILLLLLSLTALVRVESESSEANIHRLSARQNALLALNVATGELQRTLGPDQRISTPAEILEGTDNELSLGNNLSQPHLLGVWQTSSWTPGTAIDYVAQKRNNFLQWLVSYPMDERADLEALDFAADDLEGDTINLVDAATLGSLATSDPASLVRARLVEVEDSGDDQYAWAVLDEGVKATVNLPSSVDASTWGSVDSQSLASYGSPTGIGIPNISALNALESVYTNNEQARIASDPSGILAFEDAGGDADVYQKHFHDLTATSFGVLSDPVNGGLKMDLSLLSEYNSLSDSDFAPRYLYSSGSSATYSSEPSWSQVLDYMGSYRSTKLSLDGDDVPRLSSSAADWEIDSSDMLQPRDSYEPMPAIARIQMVFSVVALRTNGSYHNGNISTNTEGIYDSSYTLYLIVSPVVTIYNPYNVPIKTESLYLSLGGIPVGFTFKRADHSDYTRFVPLSERPVPLDAMITNPDTFSRIKTHGMEYVMSISAENDASDDFILAPGETMVISPFSDAEDASVNSLSNHTADRQTDRSFMQGKGGYIEGAGLVYDYLNPVRSNSHANYNYSNESDQITIIGDDEQTMSNALVNLGLNTYYLVVLDDQDEIQVDVEFVKPHFPEGEDDKPVTIQLFDKHPLDSAEEDAHLLGDYRFEYEDVDALQAAAERFTSVSFPLTQDLIPGSNLDLDGRTIQGTLTVSELVPTPLAVLDVFSQTTLANTNPTMPWAFSNPTTLAGVNQLDAVSTFNQSYQITLREGSTPSIDIDSENHGFSFTGISSLEGIKFGTHFEQPLQPLQSLASLQHANLASSGYLPKVDYVVGSSFASPLLPSGSAVSHSAELGYTLLDHSYLANDSLWDAYYLSTLATYESVFDSEAPSLSETLDNYLSGMPLMNPNLSLNLEDRDAATVRSLLLQGDSLQADAFRKIASFQYSAGAFNINSTSKDAWKALLTSAALQAIDAPPYISEADTSTTDVDSSDFDLSYNTVVRDDDTPKRYTFSRFRVTNHNRSYDEDSSNTTPSETRSSSADHAAWQGYRDLTEAQLDALAQAIVDEVKRRGPFLSLGEFINHRLGTSTADDRNLMGAIDSAIAQTDINEEVSDAMGVEVNIGSLGLDNQAYNSDTSAKGIPGFLTQADVLQQIGQRLAARSDTFRIRTYGESRNPVSGETYRAYCEAIVQRTTEYIDPDLDPWDTPNPDDLGRRFKVIGLRWLSEDEI
ncbi:hypothetical protein [Coraliomargarita parva]|uniref:hypothetical protein n=1 Tax=Coraliomargarita parva TaxID=3014050 RepID=UPI0022B39AEF|nr:hypothetical protein [Coraliomargarita parva]